MAVPVLEHSARVVSPSPTFPFGFTATAGRLLLVLFVKRDGFLDDTYPTPAGWTTIEDLVENTGGGFLDRLVVVAKDAAGGETSYTPPLLEASASREVFVVLEVSGTTLADIVSTEKGPQNSNSISDTITPAGSRPALLVGFGSAAHEQAANQWNVSAGWSILYNASSVNHPLEFVATRTIGDAEGSYSLTAGQTNSSNLYLILLSLGGEAPPFVPDIEFSVNSVKLDNLLERKIRVELNASGSGHFSIRRGDAQATEALLARGNRVAVTIPEIDPDPLVEFFIEEGDFGLISSDEEGGEVLSFSGPGSLSYLGRAVLDSVEYEGGTGTVKPSRGIWVFPDDVTEGHIINKMLNEARSASRPSDPIGSCTDTFNAINDSDGNPWSSTTLEGKWREKIGTNLLEAILRLVRAGLLHIEMTPGLVLNCYRTIGRDLTGVAFGAGVVRFAAGVNISDELARSMAGITFASHAIIRYDDGSYTRAVKDGGTPYDQETYIESNSDHANTARRQAKGQMKLREDAQEALLLSHRVPWPGDGPDEGSGIYLPGPEGTANGKYWVGDLVTLHTGTDQFDFDNATKRIYAITLYADETGHLAPPIVELNAPYIKPGSSSLPTVNGALGTIVGGSGGGAVDGGSGTPGDIALLDAWKQPVRVATTAAVTISTALNAGDSIDGVTLASGDRVLVKDQADASENGIYQAGASPSRTSDFDAGDEVLGALVHVIDGSANAGRVYRNTNTAEPTVDTDDITFTRLVPNVEDLDTAETDIDFVLSPDGAGGLVFRAESTPAGSFLTTAEGEQHQISSHGNMGATEVIDPSSGNVHTGTLDADCTLTLNAPVGSGAAFLMLEITQGGVGGWDITWPGSVTWGSGSAPSPDTTSGVVVRYLLETLDGGTTWIADLVGGSTTPTGPAGGDLDGTYPDPSVVAIDGVAVTGTPTAGDVLTASGASAATWEAPGMGSGTGGGPLLVSDDHSTPIVFGDLLLTEEGDDLLYADTW